MTHRRAKQTRGQSIVLMAFTAAFLAFTVLTTLAVGKAVRERIQIQNAADASAYSLAVQEARAFNFYAYSNRAIISHYVAMMSVFGHFSYLVYFEGVIYNLAAQWGCDCGGSDWLDIPNELEFMPLEDPMCYDVFGGEAECAECEECVQEEEEEIESDVCPNICNEMTQIDNQVGKNSPLGSCISPLYTEAKTHRSVLATALIAQQEAEDLLMQKAFLKQGLTQQIAQQFDPKYGVGVGSAAALAVGALNVTGVPLDNHNAGYCAVGGPGIGSPGPVTSTSCSAVGGGGRTSLSTQQQAANASRNGPALTLGSDWLRDRPDGFASMINVYIMGTSGFGFIPIMRMAGLTTGHGMSREVTDPANNMPGTVRNGDYNQGGCTGTHCGSGGGGSRAFAAEDYGNLGSLDAECNIECLAIVPAMADGNINVWVYTEPQGNKQGEDGTVQWADGTTTSNSQYDFGACTSSTICGVGLTTINYNPNPAPDTLFNQPHTWAVVTKSFQDTDLKQAINGSTNYSATDNEGPFGISRSLSLDGHNSYTYNNGITLQSGDPDYAPGREAMYAVAQGLAYYHRPGNWQEPPNFYNPYWRAKLHPIRMATGGSDADAAADVGVVLKAAGYPTTQAGEFAAAVGSGDWPVTE